MPHKIRTIKTRCTFHSLTAILLTHEYIWQQVDHLPRPHVKKGHLSHLVPEQHEVGAGLRETSDGVVLRQDPKQRSSHEAPESDGGVVAARDEGRGLVIGGGGGVLYKDELRHPALVPRELVTAP